MRHRTQNDPHETRARNHCAAGTHRPSGPECVEERGDIQPLCKIPQFPWNGRRRVLATGHLSPARKLFSSKWAEPRGERERAVKKPTRGGGGERAASGGGRGQWGRRRYRRRIQKWSRTRRRSVPRNGMHYSTLANLAQLFGMFLTLDARISRRHTKRSLADSCVSSANLQMHEAFSRLINRRDEEMFSFFQPDTQILLEYQPHHRHVLTPKSRDCSAQSTDKSAEILPDQPLAERSICPYHHVLNYNPQRIPASISEVECSCQHVKVNGGTIHCEPMYYNMRVMVFEDNCDTFVERVQRIAMACIPVFSNHISSGTHSMRNPTDPSTPI